MKHLKTKLILFGLSIMLISFISCKEETKNSSATNQPTEKELTQDTIHLELMANDRMQYDAKELVVGQGQIVVLKLTHEGKMSKETMGHNFVLLDQGVNGSKFSQKAVQEKDNDYIPDSDRILAHTDLIGGGESTEITFKAPEKGSYEYLCTFPGHYANMHGKFIVK